MGLSSPSTALEGCFPHPPPPRKTRSRHPRELKLAGLIAYIMSHKICKFESLTINDTWRNSQTQWQNSNLCKTKQIMYHSKGNDDSYPKCTFLLNSSQLWAFFLNFVNVYDASSTNMVMSHNPSQNIFVLS